MTRHSGTKLLRLGTRMYAMVMLDPRATFLSSDLRDENAVSFYWAPLASSIMTVGPTQNFAALARHLLFDAYATFNATKKLRRTMEIITSKREIKNACVLRVRDLVVAFSDVLEATTSKNVVKAMRRKLLKKTHANYVHPLHAQPLSRLLYPNPII